MANVQINQLPGATVPLDGTEIIPADQGLQTVQLTVQDIVTLANSNAQYKIYTALLTQTGTDAPTAIVLENTFNGEIVWTRDQNGGYIATLSGSFPQNKTFILITPNSTGVDLPIFTANWNTTDNLVFYTFDGSTLLYTDGLLINTPIEIRVYL